MVVLWFPLEYQLDEGYPFHPEEQLNRYCKEKNVLCLDLLPILKSHRDEHLFVGRESRPGSPIVRDIWHLSERGHAVTAEAVQAYLTEHNLLNAGK